ncbi:MAG: hypothetical protein LBG11_02315, partial [Bifidobacteriaceae bacterium]|nr:hypothetical protein [Bifidobacteriaceae bacterium]
MFLHLAHGIIRRPLTTVIAWAVLAVSGVGLAIFGVTGEGLFDRVNSGAPLAADSDSAVADQIIEEGAGASQSVTMAVSGVDLDDRDKLAQIVGPIADIR